MYGTKEDFAKELKLYGLNIKTLLDIKLVELKMLEQSKEIFSKAYRKSHKYSDEEYEYELHLIAIDKEINRVKERIEHYKKWIENDKQNTLDYFKCLKLS
jgi:tetratricopeptide (TPR) repeat protein